MSKETQLRSIFERILPSTLASFEQRPLPLSAHQAAADFYNAVDRYMEAVNRNQHNSARYAAEKILLESLRTLVAYEMPSAPQGVDAVRVESGTTISQEKSKIS